MLITKLSLTLLIPLLLGYALVALIYKKQKGASPLERCGLAWGLGIGLIGLIMFAEAILGMSLNAYSVFFPVSALALFLLCLVITQKQPLFDFNSIKGFFSRLISKESNQPTWIFIAEKSLILLISLTILFVFFDAMIKPILNFDDLWRQGCIAKIIFTTGKVITEQTLQLAGPHPFLNPLAQAFIYFGIGEWNDALGKVVFALCYTALLFLFYANLRNFTPRFYALLFTYFLTSFPLITYHAGTAYSDLMQTYYFTVGVIYLFRWMDDNHNPSLYFSALFFGIGNFIKQSGIPLWGIAVFAFFIYLIAEKKEKLRTSGIFVLVASLLSAPWLFHQNSFIMVRLYHLFGSSTSASAEVAATSLPYGNPTLLSILENIGKRIFTYADWQILGFIFLAIIIAGWRGIWQSRLKYLLLIILLGFAATVYAFFEPGTYQFLVDGTLAHRLIMYLAPAVLFFTALAGFFLLGNHLDIGTDVPNKRKTGKNRI